MPSDDGELNLWRFLARARADHGPEPAVVDGRRRSTYHRVGQRVDDLARFIMDPGPDHGPGLDPGDRMAVLLPNCLEFFETYFAAAGAGVILVPLNVRLTADELAHILGDSGTRLLVAGAGHRDILERLARLDTPLEGLILCDGPKTEGPTSFGALPVHRYEREVTGRRKGLEPDLAGKDEVAQIYYTSGTTGRPKGVMLTHGNVCLHARAAIRELGITQREVWGHFAPMYHLADAWATFAVTAAGGRHVMQPRFSAQATLRAIQDEKVTLTNLVPTMLNLMVNEPSVGELDHSSLRLLLSGGAPIAPGLVRRTMAVFGCDYAQTYGMTETSPYLTLSLLPDHLRELPKERQLAYKARTGRPFATVELRVVDPEGRQVADDDRQVGEIWVRGPTVTPGYWNRPAGAASASTSASASASTGKVGTVGKAGKAGSDSQTSSTAFAPGGWLRTGDLATIDKEGFVNIVDRAKDMIISGGENIYSLEVEHVLYEHPGVLEAAAFGLPDELWGERVAVAVVARPGRDLSVDELVAFIRDRLAGFKVPRSIFFLDELPKTGSGKIMKRRLKEELVSRSP